MSIKMNIHFAPGHRGHRILRQGKQPKHSKSTRLPRIARLMALAIKYEGLLSEGVIKNHKELAELAGVERSHISTILRLRLLAPDIQEWLINLPESETGNNPVTLIELRAIASHPDWDDQRQELHQLTADFNARGTSPTA